MKLFSLNHFTEKLDVFILSFPKRTVSFPLYDVTSVTGYFCSNILNQNTSYLFLILIMEFNDIEVIIARENLNNQPHSSNVGIISMRGVLSIEI